MIICVQERPETIPVSMKLENLTSYHNYTVSVVACTTACSEKSAPVTVQTDIGGRLLVYYLVSAVDHTKSFLRHKHLEKSSTLQLDKEYVMGRHRMSHCSGLT
jgi:hypothetical protein